MSSCKPDGGVDVFHLTMSFYASQIFHWRAEKSVLCFAMVEPFICNKASLGPSLDPPPEPFEGPQGTPAQFVELKLRWRTCPQKLLIIPLDHKFLVQQVFALCN
jgi:hypothetical protein